MIDSTNNLFGDKDFTLIEVSLNLCYYINNEESPDVTVSLLTF